MSTRDGLEMAHRINRIGRAIDGGAAITPRAIVEMLVAMIATRTKARLSRGWPPYAEHDYVRSHETDAARRWIEHGVDLPPIDSIFFWAAKATHPVMTVAGLHRAAGLAVPYPHNEDFARQGEDAHRAVDSSTAWRDVLAWEAGRGIAEHA